MAFTPDMRLTDDDRTEIAGLLREARAEDRLSAAELGRRLAILAEATTYREVQPLVRDLPLFGPDHPAGPRRHSGIDTATRIAWASWAVVVVSTLLVLVLVPGASRPLTWTVWAWVIVPALVFLLIASRRRRRQRPDR